MNRSGRLSSVLLAVVLSPAFLQIQCSDTDNANLVSLEVEATGLNRIVGFSPITRGYDVWVPDGVTTVTLRAHSAAPGARVNYSLIAGTITGGLLGTGGGEITLTIPLGQSLIRIDVSDGGSFQSYTVSIDPTCRLGECDDANSCTTDVCDTEVSMCEFTTLPDSAVCDLEGASGECAAGVCMDTGILEWGAVELVETRPGDAHAPRVAVDPSGNAVAAWHQWDGVRNNIWANRYTPSGGWGTPELIETDDVGSATIFDVAIDPSGNAVAVWSQWGVARDIWANRYTPSGGWGIAELIETDDAGNAFFSHVTMDSSGNALAVWEQWDGIQNDIWSNRYTPSGGWGVAERVSDSTSYDTSVQVAGDPSGNAVAVWNRWDGIQNDVWSNRYTPSDGWGVAELIETDAGNARYPQVSVDPSSNALVVWDQWDGMQTEIRSSRYTPSDGWGAVERVSNGVGNGFNPVVSVDASGNALAIWNQRETVSIPTNLWSNRYTPSGGWGTAELIATEEGYAANPKVILDLAGNGLAVWEQMDGIRWNLWSNRYTPFGGWGTPELVETRPTGLASSEVAGNPSGNAVVVWSQQRVDIYGVYNIWSNHFE